MQQRLEYMFLEDKLREVEGGSKAESVLARLNKLGKDGWEAVEMNADHGSPTMPVIILLKRPVTSS